MKYHLNGKRSLDNINCPALAKNTLAIHISFNSKIMQYALENWPSTFNEKHNKGEKDSYYYNENIYKELGL